MGAQAAPVIIESDGSVRAESMQGTLIRGSANRQQRQTYSFDSVFSTFSDQRDVFTTISPARP